MKLEGEDVVETGVAVQVSVDKNKPPKKPVVINLDDVDTDNAEAMKLVEALPGRKFQGTAATNEQVKLYQERREQYLKSR